MRKPRVLVFSWLAPVPTRRGSQVRLLHTVRHLQEIADVRLVYLDRLWEPAGGDTTGLDGVEIRSLPVRKRETAGQTLRALARRQPASIYRFYTPRAAAFVRQQIAEFQPDVFWGYLQDAALFYPPDRSVRRVLDFVDPLTLHYETLRVNSDSSLRARLVSRIQPRLEDVERTALAQTDVPVITSQRNQQHLEQYGLASPIQVLYTAVPDIFLAQKWEPHSAEKAKMLFVGNFSYSANALGVRYAIEQILPRVRESIPGAELVVAGPGQEPLAERYRQTLGVQWCGYVEDLAAVYRQADVLLVPVPYATGIQTKLVEAMAVGLPAVVSHAALHANEVQDAVHVLAADHPEEYVTAVTTLLRDAPRARQLSAAGKSLILERHSEAAHRRQIAHILDLAQGAETPARTF